MLYLYAYAINFAPGFEGLVADIFESLDCEVVFSEEAFSLVKFNSKPDLENLRFAKSIIEVFDYSDDLDDLKLSLPENFVAPIARTFVIRSFEAGRPSRLDANKREELIKDISVKTELSYSSFEPDVDFVIARRRDGKSYFGFKIPSELRSKAKDGELSSDVANLLIALGGARNGASILDAFAGYGGVSKEVLNSFNPKSVVMVEKDSRLVNFLKNEFKVERNVKVVAGDVVNFLKSHEGGFDLIIADPPWGEFENYSGDLSKLYFDFLVSAKPKLNNSGKIVIISSKKEELEKVAAESGLGVESRLNVLVSGKKVLVLKLG